MRYVIGVLVLLVTLSSVPEAAQHYTIYSGVVAEVARARGTLTLTQRDGKPIHLKVDPSLLRGVRLGQPVTVAAEGKVGRLISHPAASAEGNATRGRTQGRPVAPSAGGS